MTVGTEAREVSEQAGKSPVVVFESGLGAYKETWNKVFPEIARTNAVFAYDRPGVGASASTTRPRDGETIVGDLRTLLMERGFKPPFILVGHSSGGLYMQLFARRHPSEVAGLVLVDPTHPTQFEDLGAMRNRPASSQLLFAVALVGDAKREFDALSETGQQVLAAPGLPADVPIVILTAPDRSGGLIAEFDNAKRADFHTLYPNASILAVEGGHDVPQSNPVAVIAAVKEVIRRWCAHSGRAC